MTQREQISIQDLSDKIDIYIRDDVKWKAEIEDKLNPLVDSSKERAIIERYSKTGFKVIMAILGLIAAVGVAYSEFQRLGK